MSVINGTPHGLNHGLNPSVFFLSGAICDADRNSFDALFSMLDTTNLKARMRKYQIKHGVEEEEEVGDEEEEMKRDHLFIVCIAGYWNLKFDEIKIWLKRENIGSKINVNQFSIKRKLE